MQWDEVNPPQEPGILQYPEIGGNTLGQDEGYAEFEFAEDMEFEFAEVAEFVEFESHNPPDGFDVLNIVEDKMFTSIVSIIGREVICLTLSTCSRAHVLRCTAGVRGSGFLCCSESYPAPPSPGLGVSTEFRMFPI